MESERSWKALLSPGEAGSFFDRRPHPGFDPGDDGFHPGNAWWLAELCRLIYRQGPDEIGDKADSIHRSEILERTGLVEKCFFNRKGTQAALVASKVRPSFVAVIFRGTHEVRNWMANLDAMPVDWPRGGKVHRGFRDALQVIWDDLHLEISSLQVPLFYAGHSLGGALATLAHASLPASCVYTFGAPKVGNRDFYRSLRTDCLHRVVNGKDVVPSLPPSARGIEYLHGGRKRWLGERPDDGGSGFQIPNIGSMREALEGMRVLEAPSFLADHSPINYVKRLAEI